MTNLSDTWICVPTYWTESAETTSGGPSIYDHPTELDKNGTLARMLDSFTRLSGSFNVLIIATDTNNAVSQPVHRKVSQICQPFTNHFPIYLISKWNLKRINCHLKSQFLSLDGYGNVRNVQLVAPYVLGSKLVVGIDDDEIIDNPDYLIKVLNHFQDAKTKSAIGGLSGPYADEKGQCYIKDLDIPDKETNRFRIKKHVINEAIKILVSACSSANIVKSNMAFGGNMCIPRSTIESTCFDPFIRRGEDIDFVMNAKMNGIDFYFDADLKITHLPPDKPNENLEENKERVYADIERFIYMNEKLSYFEKTKNIKLNQNFFHPYPGVYLDQSKQLQTDAVQYLDEEFSGIESASALVNDITFKARANARKFFEFSSQWRPRLQECAASMPFKRALMKCRIE